MKQKKEKKDKHIYFHVIHNINKTHNIKCYNLMVLGYMFRLHCGHLQANLYKFPFQLKYEALMVVNMKSFVLKCITALLDGQLLMLQRKLLPSSSE